MGGREKTNLYGKSDGPSHHLACFSVECGNGTICLDPEGKPPVPITLKTLKGWHDKWSVGIECELLCTADVRMDPGSAQDKDGWWKSSQFRMQIDLACVIFRTVFGDPSGSRFRLVAHIDWSQGHAAMPLDGLNAEKMLCGHDKASATHLRHTFYPYPILGALGHSVPREILCEPGCKECLEAFKAHGDPASPKYNPNFQSIGVKGLHIVLRERGMFQGGMVQEECVSMLQKCPDFAKKDLMERAAVTDQMKGYQYVALFGVKYHAELAHIERKWIQLKRIVRSRLDGSLPKLQRLIADYFKLYIVDDARKAARHCRETMRAYYKLGSLDLDTLRKEELKMKGHRRVFDSVTGKFVFSAGLKQSEQAKKMALRTERRRLCTKAKAAFDARKESEWQAQLRRTANHLASDTTKGERKSKTKIRKAEMIMRECEVEGANVSAKKAKWAKDTLKVKDDKS